MTRLQQLEEELAQFERWRDELRKNATIKVGIHGVPCSGKTAFLVSLYLHRFDETSGMRICFDEHSLVYLRGLADHFLNHGHMEATGAASPKNISFDITTNDGTKIRIETRDLAGRLVEPRDGSCDIANSAREFIAKCNTILCFADCREITYPAEDAIDLLPTNSTVLFMPTKIDCLLENPERLLKLDRKQADAIYESAQLDVTRKLDRHFRSRWAANRYKCVPIAALGPIGDAGGAGTPLPINPRDLRPHNLHVPLQIIVSAKLEELNAEESEVNGQITAVKAEIAAERSRIREEERIRGQKRARQLAARAQELAQRRDMLESRLEEIEGLWFDVSWENLPRMFASQMRLRRIEADARQAGLGDLAQKAGMMKLDLGFWLFAPIVMAFFGLILVAWMNR